MPSIFTRIVNGEIPSYKVAEDEYCYAFLDINPLNEGHTLVVPKKEVDYLFDLDDATYAHLFGFAKQVAGALGRAVPCLRVGVAVVGLEVPHAHIHLVPLHGIHDLDFSRPKLKLPPAQMQELAGRIAARMGG
jgi:histidine triad (HIT) family protein